MNEDAKCDGLAFCSRLFRFFSRLFGLILSCFFDCGLFYGFWFFIAATGNEQQTKDNQKSYH